MTIMDYTLILDGILSPWYDVKFSLMLIILTISLSRAPYAAVDIEWAGALYICEILG
jgi:hypothetical protein